MTERIRLDPGKLLGRALEANSGVAPEDQEFVDVLTRWLESMNTDANLTDAAVISTAADTERLLGHRLRVRREIAAEPKILDEPVDDPVVITGLARTGTTKLQRVVAAVPGAQKLPYWRLINPTPLLGTTSVTPDPRIELARQQLALMASHAPEVLALHPMKAEEADEEIFAMEMTFECLASALRAGPSFMAWWQARDPLPTYRYLRRLLQYFQWVDGGRLGPWILKAPAHLDNLDAIVEVFPEATIVHCHRDPRQSFRSGLRLHEVAKSMSVVGFEPTEAGPRLLQYWSAVMRRNMEQRSRPEVDSHVIDVSFGRVCSSPVDVAREIFDRRDKVLEAADVASIEAWLDADHHEARPTYPGYALERYGLTDHMVAAAFQDYMEAFASFIADEHRS